MKAKCPLCVLVTILVFVISAVILTGAGIHDDEVGDADYIAIFWTEGEHAEYLEELSDYYTMETEVFVFVDTMPGSDFREIVFTELGEHSEAFDIVVGESGWLEEGVSRGHFVELTGLVDELGAEASVAEGELSASGEYPEGSGRYWAVPVMGGQEAFVVAYSQKHELSLDWLEWFVKPETQAMWDELGGPFAVTEAAETQ